MPVPKPIKTQIIQKVQKKTFPNKTPLKEKRSPKDDENSSDENAKFESSPISEDEPMPETLAVSIHSRGLSLISG